MHGPHAASGLRGIIALAEQGREPLKQIVRSLVRRTGTDEAWEAGARPETDLASSDDAGAPFAPQTKAPTGTRRVANPRVALFATCLVDTMRPTIGFAAAKLLEDAGCRVEVPRQTCCGQPAFNSGDRTTSKALALQMIEAFESFDYIVVPSGSCGGMIKAHYPELFAGDPNLALRAEKLAAKTFELVSFLTDVMGVTSVAARHDGTVTYHDSCSGLRELGIQSQPRKLLATVEGLTLVEMKDSDVCCGFGGTFAVKYGEISDKIVAEKAGNVSASEAGTLLAGDLGCLMNMAGKLSRNGSAIEVRHVAEILAGMTDTPAIGKAPKAKEATS